MSKKEIIYSDIDLGFQRHPVKNDVSKNTNVEAVKRSVLNLLFLKHYEKLKQPDIGCDIYSYLFEPVDAITASNIKNAVEDVINNYEPRVELVSVVVKPDVQNQTYDVIITFNIISIGDDVDLKVTLDKKR